MSQPRCAFRPGSVQEGCPTHATRHRKQAVGVLTNRLQPVGKLAVSAGKLQHLVRILDRDEARAGRDI